MEDPLESSSESNIIVDGVKDFPDSPHDVKQKGLQFQNGKEGGGGGGGRERGGNWY